MLDRRSLLRRAAMIAAARFAAAGVPSGAIDRAKPRGYPFELGVASGEPASDNFVLWTRPTGLTGDTPIGFEIAEDEGFRRIVRHGRTIATTARGHAVHLEIMGLAPGRPYFYRFYLGDAVSPVGRSFTIADRVDRLRLALTSCQHWEQGWFSAYADILAAGADAVLQVGDYIYEHSFGSGPNVRRFDAPDPHDLAGYRARHALYRTDPHLAAAHAAMPFIVCWDDHEVENDYAGGQGVETVDPAAFLHRRAAAYQAYFEHMPVRPSTVLRGSEFRLYRRLAWGDLATLHMLDCRQYRTPQPCSPKRGGQVIEPCGEMVAPGATMLGASQHRWFERGLANERARWSLVAQSTLFSRLILPQGPNARYSDIWDGYPGSRDRVIDAIGNPAVRNTLVLGGDVHSFWMADVKRDFTDPSSPTIATEVVTSCLASRNGPEALFAGAEARNPHIRFHDNSRAGYALLDLDRARVTIDLRAVDSLVDPASRCTSLARFVVANRWPGAIRA